MLNFIAGIIVALFPSLLVKLLFMDEQEKSNLGRNLNSALSFLKRLSNNPSVHRLTLLLTLISLILYA